VDPIDPIVSEYDRVFQGISVEGIDLAAANRLSFYMAIRSGTEFASPSIQARIRMTLHAYAIFARDLLRRISSAPPLPRSDTLKALYFFEGLNPSVEKTMGNMLEQFAPEQSRIAIAEDGDSPLKSSFDWLAVKTLAPKGVARSLGGLAATLLWCQRRARLPILRRQSLHAWLLRMALRTAGAAYACRRLLDAFPTTILITASDTRFWGHCITLEANRRGIPTLTLQHGTMVGEAGTVPVISHRIAAWGKASARWLRDRGVPAGKIVVTGAPRLDAIVNDPRRSREALAEDLGVDPTKRWVVLATNPIPFAHNAAQLTIAREGVRAWGEPAILLVKLHPSEHTESYRSVIGQDPAVALVPHGRVDLYDLLDAAAAVLTFHSTVGLEAMMLDRPVVSLEAFGEQNPLPYARAGAAAAARCPEELARALSGDIPPGANASKRRELRDRFVRDNMLAVDGKSAERVQVLIKSLISERSP
jgi:hypothetical protein